MKQQNCVQNHNKLLVEHFSRMKCFELNQIKLNEIMFNVTILNKHKPKFLSKWLLIKINIYQFQGRKIL